MESCFQGNSVERAADWVFSHANELDAMETETESNVQNKCPDGPGSKDTEHPIL